MKTVEPSRRDEVLEDQDISAARKGEHLLRRELQVLKASGEDHSHHGLHLFLDFKYIV